MIITILFYIDGGGGSGDLKHLNLLSISPVRGEKNPSIVYE